MSGLIVCGDCKHQVPSDLPGWEPCPTCGHVAVTDPDEIARIKRANEEYRARMAALLADISTEASK